MNELVIGEMGKGGGSTPIEASDTLFANQILKLLFAVSSGPIGGVEEVYINNIPISVLSSETTFKTFYYEERLGTPNQGLLEGFATATTSIQFAASELKHVNNTAIPVFASIPYDAETVKVIFTIDKLMKVESTGDISEYSVSVDVFTNNNFSEDDAQANNAAGTEAILHWVPYSTKTTTVKGKASNPYTFAVAINRPSNVSYGSRWGIKFKKSSTPDDDTAVKRSRYSRISVSYLFGITSNITYNDIDLRYPNTAIVGITLEDAKRIGSNEPNVLFKLKGTKVKVPYRNKEVIVNGVPHPGDIVFSQDPDTAKNRTYTGVTWDYTLDTTWWTTNVSWNLLYVLTDATNGLGIPMKDIDLMSFFIFGKECDKVITYDLDGVAGKTRYKYEISNQFNTRESPQTFINYFLTIGNARLTTNAFGLLTVICDMERPVTRLVTNANVVDGIFNYSSSALENRFTSINVTYNNAEARGATETVTIPYGIPHDTYEKPYVLRYGRQVNDIVLVGCYNKHQAIAKGRWAFYSSCVLTQLVNFTLFTEGMTYSIGDIIEIMDDANMDIIAQGRIKAANIGPNGYLNVTLDRNVTTSSQCYLHYYHNGTYIKTKIGINASGDAVVSSTGNSNMLLPDINSVFSITSLTKSSTWEVVGLSFDRDSLKTVVYCVEYSIDKYAYIDSPISQPSITSGLNINDLSYITCNPVEDLVAERENITLGQFLGYTNRGVVTWKWFENDYVRGEYNKDTSQGIPNKLRPYYNVYYRNLRTGNDFKKIEVKSGAMTAYIDNLTEGSYEVQVEAFLPLTNATSTVKSTTFQFFTESDEQLSTASLYLGDVGSTIESGRIFTGSISMPSHFWLDKILSVTMDKADAPIRIRLYNDDITTPFTTLEEEKIIPFNPKKRNNTKFSSLSFDALVSRWYDKKGVIGIQIDKKGTLLYYIITYTGTPVVGPINITLYYSLKKYG